MAASNPLLDPPTTDQKANTDSPSPAPLPTTEKKREALLGFIDFYHPSYPHSPPLLSLHASDEGGVHYTVAYYACCIVAGNIWDDSEGRNGDKNVPYLSMLGKYRASPIAIPADDILREKQYYFHAGNKKECNYNIVPCFGEWAFRREIPKPWRSLKTSRHSNSLDPENRQEQLSGGPSQTSSCRIIKTSARDHSFHVIPLSDQKWFDLNHMRRYALCISHGEPQHSTCNTMPLSRDIYNEFESGRLVLIPKPDPQAPGAYKMVTHVLQRSHGSNDSVLKSIASFHNKEYHLLKDPCEDVPVEYLFAHFARSLFTDTILQLFNRDDDEEFNILERYNNRILSSSDADFPRPRSELPPEIRVSRGTKRSRSQMEEEKEEDDDNDGFYPRNDHEHLFDYHRW